MIKLIHSADLHFDGAFPLRDPIKAETRKNELRAAFSSLIYWAKTENADFLVLAGDLFDTPHPTPQTVEFVLSQLRLIPSCRVLITPGEHDYLATDGVYQTYAFPENVTVFCSDKLTHETFTTASGETVTVYGRAFTLPTASENPLSGLSLEESDTVRLLILHADLDKDSHYAPITLADIQKSHADYVALGHRHNEPGIKKLDNTYFGYAGSLESHSFSDCGERGAYKLDITKTGGVTTCRPSFFRLSKRVYAVDTLDMSGIRTLDEGKNKLLTEFKAKGYQKDTLLRLTLTGDVPYEVSLNEKALADTLASLYYCEIVDETSPTFDMEALKKDPTVKGELARTLAPLFDSQDEEERRCARRALKYGILALMGADVGEV